MFSVRKALSSLRHPAPRRPAKRAKLRCEQLPDRLNPTTTGTFTASLWSVNGSFTYDETQIDYNSAEQTLPLNDLSFSSSAGTYTADENPVEATLHYGLFYSMYFEATSDQSGAPHLSVDIVQNSAHIVNLDHPSVYWDVSVDVDLAVKTSITLDFSTIKTGVAYTLTIVIKDKDGATMANFELAVAANMTATQIRDAVAGGLSADGIDFETTSDGATKLKIGQQNGKSAQSFDIAAVDANDDYVAGPKLTQREGVPTVTINGDPVTPGN